MKKRIRFALTLLSRTFHGEMRLRETFNITIFVERDAD